MKNISTSRIVKTTLKFGEYLLFLGCSGLIIFYLFKTIIGDPKDLKSSSVKVIRIDNNVDTLRNKVDTIMGIQAYMTDRISVLEENQVQLHETVIETNKLIRQTNKEIYNLRKIIKETKYNQQQKLTNNNQKLDNFFEKRKNN